MFTRIALLPVVFALVAQPAPRACTGFLAADAVTVLVGNNEDYKVPNTRVWVLPAEPGKFGRIYFGFDDFVPQGGVNEKGLFFDCFAVNPELASRAGDKPDPPLNFTDRIMSECATVDEALAMIERYNRDFLEKYQLFFADAAGNSAIVENNAILRKQGRFQVVTNFRQSEATTVTCDRFRIAAQMLSASATCDKDLCRRILSAVHNEGNNPTLYSNIYDLKNGRIYLYHFHNFENEVVIDVAAELKKGKRFLTLVSVFPETYVATVYARKMNAALEQQIAARRMKNPDLAAYPDFVGEYMVAGNTLKITVQDGRLYVETPQIPAIEVLPEAADTFFYLTHVSDMRLAFTRAPNHQVNGVLVTQNGKTFPGSKTTGISYKPRYR